MLESYLMRVLGHGDIRFNKGYSRIARWKREERIDRYTKKKHLFLKTALQIRRIYFNFHSKNPLMGPVSSRWGKRKFHPSSGMYNTDLKSPLWVISRSPERLALFGVSTHGISSDRWIRLGNQTTGNWRRSLLG